MGVAPARPAAAGAPSGAPAPALLGRRAVLVPVKSFALAKRRLDAALGDEERRALVRRMAEHVVSGGGAPARSPWSATTPRWPTGPAGSGPWWCGSRAGG